MRLHEIHSLSGQSLHPRDVLAPSRRGRCLAVVTALFAGSLCLGPADAAEVQALNLIEHAGGEPLIDLGAEGDSAGDLLAFENEVYDETDTRKVGSIHGWCMRVVVGKSWECVWTLFHDDGQITVEGPFFDASDSTVAVTGGTTRSRGVGTD